MIQPTPKRRLTSSSMTKAAITAKMPTPETKENHAGAPRERMVAHAAKKTTTRVAPPNHIESVGMNQCDDSNFFQFLVGVLFAGAVVVGYLPQIRRMFTLRTDSGVSFATIMLLMLRSTLTYITVLPRFRMMVECLDLYEWRSAGLALLPLMLSGLDAACLSLIAGKMIFHSKSRGPRLSVALANVMLPPCLTVAAGVYMFMREEQTLFEVTGVLASVVAAIAWLPQMALSWNGQSLVLSPPMLFVQCVASVCIVVYFAIFASPTLPVYAWAPYLVSASMVGMIIYRQRVNGITSHTGPASTFVRGREEDPEEASTSSDP